MQIAKWNEQTQTPYDIRPRESVPASNGLPFADMASLERLGYYEYQPVPLAEGEGLDGVAYTFEGGIIRQAGTIIGADAMRLEAEAAEAEAKRLADQAEADRVMKLATDNKSAMLELVGLLAVFGLPFPVSESVAESAIYAQTKADPTKAADGVLLMRRYQQLTEALGADMMAVITLIKGGV